MHDRAPDHRPLGPRPQQFPGTLGNAESPPKKTPKMPTPRHVTTQMPKVKDKARILKSSRRKAVSYLRGAPRWTGASFIQRRFAGQKGWAQNLRRDENPDGKAATLRPRPATSAGRPPTPPLPGVSPVSTLITVITTALIFTSRLIPYRPKRL